MPQRPNLVLASGSPRRRELLRTLGLQPTVRPADIAETRRADEAPETYVARLAKEKARADARPGELILAADTVVVLEGDSLGKPRDEADATSMLTMLSGRSHQVLTSVALLEVDADRLLSETCSTKVRMAPMGKEEIDWYVRSGEPLDKAGAYAIQGVGGLFVTEIEGNYTNVVGLPLPTVYRLLGEMGHAALLRER